MKKLFRQILQDWRMFRELRTVVSADCRWRLLEELLFSPAALRSRYEQNKRFHLELSSRWKC